MYELGYNVLSASGTSSNGVSSSNEASNEACSSNETDEESNEDLKEEQLSQAASDVAVVVVPRSSSSSNSKTSSPNNGSAKSDTTSGEKQQQQQQNLGLAKHHGKSTGNTPSTRNGNEALLNFPTPKNFAERLMNVLDSGIISDCIRWASDGKAVALHPKKLRKGTVLQDYFSSSSYSSFLRNFNRWYVSFCSLLKCGVSSRILSFT